MMNENEAEIDRERLEPMDTANCNNYPNNIALIALFKVGYLSISKLKSVFIEVSGANPNHTLPHLYGQYRVKIPSRLFILQ